MSCEVAKRKYSLSAPPSGRSRRRRARPGRFPVISDVQAGGVSAGTTVRSVAARASPHEIAEERHHPTRHQRVEMVKVAPSRPMKSVFRSSRSPPDRLAAVLRDESTSSPTETSRSSIGRWPISASTRRTAAFHNASGSPFRAPRGRATPGRGRQAARLGRDLAAVLPVAGELGHQPYDVRQNVWISDHRHTDHSRVVR